MSFELNPFTHLGKEWEDLTRRVTELETKIAQLSAQPALQAPASGPYAPPPGAAVQAPPGWPAGGLGTPSAPTSAPAPQAPQTPATPPTQPAPGPQSVPSFEQLQDRMLQLSQAKGDAACISLIAAHGGKDEEGTVKISLVPQERYAALFAEIGSQLGLH